MFVAISTFRSKSLVASKERKIASFRQECELGLCWFDKPRERWAYSAQSCDGRHACTIQQTSAIINYSYEVTSCRTWTETNEHRTSSMSRVNWRRHRFVSISPLAIYNQQGNFANLPTEKSLPKVFSKFFWYRSFRSLFVFCRMACLTDCAGSRCFFIICLSASNGKNLISALCRN